MQYVIRYILSEALMLHLRFAAEGAEHDLKFTIVRPFNWIGPRMDFIPGVDGPKDAVPRVLACFSNVSRCILSSNAVG